MSYSLPQQHNVVDDKQQQVHTHVSVCPTFLLSPGFPPLKLVLFGFVGTVQEVPPEGNGEENESY
jgi:hypothetical protein